MKRADLEASVTRLARDKGWRVYLRGGSVRAGSHPDFPDCVLLRPPRMLLVNFRDDPAGSSTQDEALWLNGAARVAGVLAWTWTPVEWDRGEIEQVLT